MSQLESRIERLEQQVGMVEVPVWVRDLNDADRDFYLALKGREARHPRGFDGLIKTMDESELIRLIGLLTCAVDDDDMSRLNAKTRAEVRAMRGRYG